MKFIHIRVYVVCREKKQYILFNNYLTFVFLWDETQAGVNNIGDVNSARGVYTNLAFLNLYPHGLYRSQSGLGVYLARISETLSRMFKC